MDDATETKTRPSSAFTESRSDDLKARSEQATTADQHREVTREAITVVDDMRLAMETRSTIDIAKGLVMAAMGCDEQVAFGHLVSMSQRQQTKLHQVAFEVIESHQSTASCNGHTRPVGGGVAG